MPIICHDRWTGIPLMSYYYYMQRHFTGLLLRPSFFSSVINSLLTLIILGLTNWSYMLEKLPFYETFFGTDGFVKSGSDAASGGGAGGGLFGDTISYNVLILACALFVGIAVYIGLQLISRLANDASATWESLHAQTENGIKTIIQRSVIRVVIGISWIIYTVMFLKVILSFCILASQVGVKELWAAKGFGYLAFGIIMLWLALHLHTVFMRLLVLRPRVWGGNDDILEDEFRNHFNVTDYRG